MPIIAIIGTSGVGKSFLVRQLASLDCAPCFLEGEEGVIPEKIFKNVFAHDPVERFQWFLDRFDTIYKKAEKMSKQDITVYIDGAPISAKAHVQYEEKKYHAELKKRIDALNCAKPDKILLVVADKKKLASMIVARGRKTEELNKAVNRAMDIQKSFLALTKNQKNVIIIDRTALDFSKENDLQKIKKIVDEKI